MKTVRDVLPRFTGLKLPVRIGVVSAASVLLLLITALLAEPTDDLAGDVNATSTTTTTTTTTTNTTTTTTTTTTTIPEYPGWVDPETVGMPWGTEVRGLLTFRGNPTRTFYGEGPVPAAPQILWKFPTAGSLCSLSTTGGETTTWCGSGWTGQPAVFEYNGKTWVTQGSYSGSIHFLDFTDGSQILPDFPTGDLVKGSVTVDPDGFPLLYAGSRDGYYRVLAFDGDEPVELWKLSARDVVPTMWNDDWDGAGLVLEDYLFIGGENSQFHIVKLNRGYDSDGRVGVDPHLVFNAPGWDDELIAAVGPNVSIENSVAISGNVVYFANSGGLIQGWDITDLADGADPTRVFRFWAGDDVDATLVIDKDQMIYAAAEYERGNARSEEVGQIFKLDPSRPDDPLVWKTDARPYTGAGVWATPGLHNDILIVPTDSGSVLGLDRATGAQRWSVELQGPTWSSPVIVDDVWIQGDCAGSLRGFDVSDTTVEPPQLWQVNLGGCIESTPAVWGGRIIVGTRAGQIVAVG